MRSIPLVVAVAALWLLPSSVGAQAVETFEYTVERGDSCSRIAQRFFGSSRRYDIIHRYNRNLGPTPHRLAPGSTLVLPRSESPTGPDARLTQVIRRVEARQPAAEEWRPAARGQELFRGWRVNTRPTAAAQLTFRDTSALWLRENTLVILYGGEAGATRRQTTTARLDHGTLRSRLGELRMNVTTPSSEARFAGGSSVVSVAEDGTSRVSHHDGGAATVANADGASVQVRPGFGTKVQPAQRPMRPRPLPPAPTWIDGPVRFVGIAGEGATLLGEWQAVPDARVYRVEISRVGEQGLIAAAEVPANVTRFEVHRIPDGEYEVRLSTIDGDSFESRPSDLRAMTVVLAALEIPGVPATRTAVPEPDPSEEPEPLTVPPGAVVVAPAPLRCSVGDAEPAERAVLREVGSAQLRCTDSGGEVIAAPSLRVTAPELLASNDEGLRQVALVRGQSAEVVLTAPEGSALPDFVQGSDGLEAELVERRSPHEMVVRVTIAADAPDDAALSVLASADVDAVAVTQIALRVVDPERAAEVFVAPEEPPEPSGPRAVRSSDAMSLIVNPSLLSVRGEGRSFEIAGAFATHLDGGAAVFIPSVAVSAGFRDELVRASVGVAAGRNSDGDLRIEGGAADMSLGLGWRFLGRETARGFIELAAWLPTGSDSGSLGRGRFVPSVELALLPSDRILLRTRQGAVYDFSNDGTQAWASSYGADVLILGRRTDDSEAGLTAGLALDLALGERQEQLHTALGLGLLIGAHVSPFDVQLGARYAITNDLVAVSGRWQIVAALRFRLPYD